MAAYLLFLANNLLQPGQLQAQGANADRGNQAGLITRAVNESERFTLTGSTHQLASTGADRATDLGATPASMPAERILLLLKRSPEREAQLRAAIESLHDSNSPSFHKWMTPAEFGAQWGAADSDIAAITAWLQSHGFMVKGATAGRTAIEFSGTAGQIEGAFHTSIHIYQVNGELHHANVQDPQIPTAFAPVIAGIATLNDFRPRSLSTPGPRGIYDATTHKVRPELTASGSSGDFLYVGPADAATIYNAPNKLLNPNAAGNTFDGTGAKIGIIGDSNISVTQNANYRKIFGLAANAPTVIVDGATDPGVNGDAVEAYLDTEVAGGLAPGAKVYLYTAADTNTDVGINLATSRAVNDNLVDVLSISFGECEAGLAYPGNQFYASMWEQAAAQGISVTVATGDSGSAGCDDPHSETVAQYGMQVNGVASTPYNIAVGGTDFAALAGPDGNGANFNQYVSASNTQGTMRSAMGYIPEVPWNDTFLNFPPGQIARAKPATGTYGNITAAGGGKSNCSQGYFGGNGDPYCITGYPKPSWQSAPGVPADNARDIPDVSLFAANGLYYAAWAICTDQQKNASGNTVSDCTPGSNGLPADEFYISGVGGTSASAPAFAGILALVKQATGDRQGQANYVLYNLARTKAASLHDVTTGNNSVPCQSGTEDCASNNEGAFYLKGWNAVAGFDLASGLGSVNISTLISDWVGSGLSSTTTRLSLAPASIQHGEIVNAQATVTTSNGVAATGDVALSAYANPPTFKMGSAIGAYPLLESGTDASSTGSIGINHLPGGQYKVIATYGGSPEFSESVSSPVDVTVTPESSVSSIVISSYDPSTNSLASPTHYGYFIGIAAHPYGMRSPIVNGQEQDDGIATGSITFAVNGKALQTDLLDTRALASYNITTGNMLNAGKYTVTAAYSGDNSFDPSVGSQTLTIIKAVTKLALSSSSNAYQGHAVTFTIQLNSDSKGIAPTGSIALESGSTILAQAPLVGIGAGDNTTATATATISTTNLPAGLHDLVAVYLGDANYAPSTSNGLEITGRPFFTIANTTAYLSSEHTTGAPYMVTTSVGGYAGTINYTCALEGANTEASPPECAFFPSSSAALTADATIDQEVLLFGKGTKLPKGITIGSNQTQPGFGPGVKLGAGLMAVACCLLFGIPARRRGWKSILSVVLLLAAVSGFTACGSQPKFISAGQYIFKVVGTDSVDVTNIATATITVTVK